MEAGEKSSGIDHMLRQATPGFDEFTQTNFTLLQMINNETNKMRVLDLDSAIVSSSIDHDSSLFCKSI
jgi:hypothetical protein